jgi:hypothetical protein
MISLVVHCDTPFASFEYTIVACLGLKFVVALLWYSLL